MLVLPLGAGVDQSSLEGFFELSNGCICCSVKDDLITTLEQLALHKSKFDYILIEATGLLCILHKSIKLFTERSTIFCAL